MYIYSVPSCQDIHELFQCGVVKGEAPLVPCDVRIDIAWTYTGLPLAAHVASVSWPQPFFSAAFRQQADRAGNEYYGCAVGRSFDIEFRTIFLYITVVGLDNER